MSKTIDERVNEIRAVVCVRKLWLANAGWAMAFVFNEEQQKQGWADNPAYRDPNYYRYGTVIAYYDSIEECVAAEYAVWVEKKPRPERRTFDGRTRAEINGPPRLRLIK